MSKEKSALLFNFTVKQTHSAVGSISKITEFDWKIMEFLGLTIRAREKKSVCVFFFQLCLLWNGKKGVN